MSGAVQFTYELTGTGWSEGRLVVGDTSAVVTASYLSDALGDVLRAVLALARGARAARAVWMEEPGEYEWIFESDTETVRIRILAFPDWRQTIDPSDDDKGTVVLDAQGDFTAVVKAFASGVRSVLDRHGEDGYLAAWIDAPFPTPELQALEELAKAL